MKNTHFIILLLIVLSSRLSLAQELIGVIRDASLGNGVPSAVVSIEELNLQTLTDDSGYFSIEYDGLFNRGKLNLKVNRIGYEAVDVEIGSKLLHSPLIVRLNSLVIPSQSIMIKAFNTTSLRNTMIFSGLDEKTLDRTYTTQDVPEILASLPSTTYYSEGGNGIGYNYLSIRGFDQRRIAVMINGIPQNDPEDHNVYWIDIADIIGSTELIEIQRGSGGGVYGSPAIGGAINIVTKQYTLHPELKLSAATGSFNTRRYSAEASSGLIGGKYSFLAKLAKISSTGYRENSWTDMNSYHFAATRFDEDITTQLNIYGGPIADGLVYTGLPKFAVKDKSLRRKNFSFWMQDNNAFTYVTPRRVEELENFSQPHYELLNEWRITPALKLNSAIFYTIGKGFFDYDGSWGNYSYFRLKPEYGIPVAGDPDTMFMSNVLIRATVENHQFGWLPRILYKHENGELIVGAELRKHRSFKWGIINFANGIPGGVDRNHRYHEFKSSKDIAGFFVNETYSLSDQIEASGELHLTYNSYRIYEEKYAGNDFKVSHLFINPRLSLTYKVNTENLLYFAAGSVSREPRLRNYYDAAEASGGALPQFTKKTDGTFNFDDPLVKPEKMTSFDAGYSFNSESVKLNFNGFYMDFRDEIVKLGQIDKLGVPTTGNAESTVHYGVEASGAISFPYGFKLIVNGTVSANYFRSGTAYLPYNDGSGDTIISLNLKDNSIAGFPPVILNAVLSYSGYNFFVQFSAKYVGSYYSDNFDSDITQLNSNYPGITGYSDNTNDSYLNTDLLVSYNIALIGSTPSKFYFKVNNLFNSLYSMNAIGGEFFPAAERNLIAGIELGLF